MEEHFVPTMFTTENKSHDVVQKRPSTFWVVGDEIVPWDRMCEISDEHPCSGVAETESNCHRKHELPTFSKRPAKGESSQHPHTCPDEQHETVMLQSAWEPLLPELFVTFATWSSIWEVAVPFHCENCTGIVQAEEM